MGRFVIFLLTIYQLQTTIRTASVVDTPRYNLNSLTSNEDDFNALMLPPESADTSTSSEESSAEDEANFMPFVKTGHDQTEVEFRYPLSAVNIDYLRNVIILKFRKERPGERMSKLSAEEQEQRKSLDNNFMRFGKRQADESPTAHNIERIYYERNGRSNEGMRDSRGDNFMRFGRSAASSKDFMRFGRQPSQDFMRFGRSPADFMRLGRSSADFMRLGRSPADFMRLGRSGPDDFMRFGRSPSQDFMRFGRNPGQDFMRFGRNPSQDFMRFGRNPSQDFMRFGRTQKLPSQYVDKNFMRFGRLDNFMRFGRTPPPEDSAENFMRFGKMNQDFMRFGKRAEQTGKLNQTKPMLQKEDVKNAAKLLQQTEKETEQSNPMDKAIKVFFSKQAQQQQQQAREEPKSGEEANASNNEDLDMETQYI